MTNDTANPYVGLRPFEQDESILFFGRNEQTLELLQRLHQHRFVAVVGSSGSGKSSLLKAGLIPALKAGYLVDDSDDWFIADMKPGINPLDNLAKSLLIRLDPAAGDMEIKELVKSINEEGSDALLRLLQPMHKNRNTNFFLLVDQFEELFRFILDQKNEAKKDEAIDFVNIMLELTQQKDIPFYVVITMRSDFIGDCAQFFGLPEAMNKSQYLVPRLSRMEMKSVIESPAKLYGGKINPALTSRLLNDLGKVKDELPLLQHALMRMWDFETNKNKSGEIDLKDYEETGGIEKALNNHADEAMSGLNEEEIAITKKIFQGLTAVDENGRKIRRPILLSRLKMITGVSEEILLKLIDRFIRDGRSFLVLTKAADNDKIIDISHESLIRQWNTLSQWVEEEGESAAVYLRLAEATKLNKEKKKDFLSGSELQIAFDWYNKYKPSAVWANRYKPGFEEAEKYLLESEKTERAMHEAEASRLKEEKSIKRRQKIMIGGIGILLVLGAAATYVIYDSSRKNKIIENQLVVTDIARVKAQQQKIIADSLADEAYKQKLKADSFAIKADEQKKIAETQTQEALKQREFAMRQQMRAQEQTEMAQRERIRAIKAAEASKQQGEQALVQKDLLASRFKTLIEANDKINSIIKDLSKQKNIDSIKTRLNSVSDIFKQIDGAKDDFEILDTDFLSFSKLSSLKPNQAIISKNKKYILAFSKDGNLVVYKKNGMVARWESGTLSANFARMTEDGNFIIGFEQPGSDLFWQGWQTGTKGHPKAYIVMQEDGNLVIYDDSGDHKNPIWASNSFDPNWQWDD